MEIKIREATIDDIELLLKWRMEVLREVFSLPQDLSLAQLKEENRQYYKKELTSNGHIAIFAYIDDQIVGCGGVCLYQEMPSPDNLNGKCAYLMNIYTRSPYRKHGVGKAIINWLIDRARYQGATKIYLETSVSGKSLYQKNGFVSMGNMMKLADIKNANKFNQ
ncbi:GNAT family N-acetyltransferase [Thomasclavelia sp.]|uniref:GNAT family N-acetyltransferase n=1 Tax=Thomasclavelia sp. TaxID=3025757 RepID=UPI0025F42296|nr:GNAT family N-acetyltransferase [Thomasclavelia sp.]